MTREEAIKELKEYEDGLDLEYATPFDKAILHAIKALEQEPNTWSLDDAREDFMHDVYNTLDFLPTNNEANRIIDSFDRVTSSIKQEPIIDKIRTEIIELRSKQNVGVLECLDIIDKL